MNKQTIITILLALVAMAGQAQVKCHVEGKIMTDKYGDDVVVCKDGTDLRVNDDPSLHYKAVNGRFECDIKTDHIEKYAVKLPRQMDEGSWFTARFLAENGTVWIEMYEDKAPKVRSTGEEGLLHHALDSIEDVRFWNPVEVIDNQIGDESRRAEFYNADFISVMNEVHTWDEESLPQAYVDSVRQVVDYYMQNKRARYTDAGWLLKQRRDSITADLVPFRLTYAKEHPMLWTLYDVLDNIKALIHADIYVNFDKSQFEPYLTLYHDILINYYPGHPIHEQIATAPAALRLQPGKPYIDYTVRNVDGQLVPISTLTKGNVALINLWASWCGPCRKHSKDMIPVYEKYKDKGFTVIAIAREQKAEAMEKAHRHDAYPWSSLLELNDENRIWELNGVGNGGGAMFLIDRDGTILSTSTDAEELEPLIKKALNID